VIKDSDTSETRFSSGDTVYEMIVAQGERQPDAPAILAPGRRPMTFHKLRECVDTTVDALNSVGIGLNDRVVSVLPTGPEMAVAFLATASGATNVPLSPDLREEELFFHLENPGVKGIIVESGSSPEARTVAAAKEIPIIELKPDPREAAGVFSLDAEGAESAPSHSRNRGRTGDTALVLHTSGTTSRPKIVPLTHTNICLSAKNVASVLRLTHRDRCLNVMPLFHAHGLIACVLASLSVGGSVVCTPGYSPADFFRWMESFSATWFSAVPTIHHSVLEQAKKHEGPIARSSLRLIRSATSAMPPGLMRGLEATFGVPVIESYGMTETGTQITSNLLPPGKRKPGSAGIPAGPEVAIIDTRGHWLPQGETGEIVIRGPTVVDAYESDPAANKEAFFEDWLRTGDEGYLDQDGYLFISGRLKEMINRGGEKVAPREIDEALLAHPDIAQAVAFPIPHPTLGEEVAVAVVQKPRAGLTEEAIRAFLFRALAPFKVPSRVFLVDAIPEGPTGKVQRATLFEELATSRTQAFVEPEGPVEKEVASIWAEVLGVQRIGATDNFFDLGGDSLRATQIISRIREAFQVEISLAKVFREPTVRGLSKEIRSSLGENGICWERPSSGKADVSLSQDSVGEPER